LRWDVSSAAVADKPVHDFTGASSWRFAHLKWADVATHCVTIHGKFKLPREKQKNIGQTAGKFSKNEKQAAVKGWKRAS